MSLDRLHLNERKKGKRDRDNEERKVPNKKGVKKNEYINEALKSIDRDSSSSEEYKAKPQNQYKNKKAKPEVPSKGKSSYPKGVG